MNTAEYLLKQYMLNTSLKGIMAVCKLGTELRQNCKPSFLTRMLHGHPTVMVLKQIDLPIYLSTNNSTHSFLTANSIIHLFSRSL